MVILEIYNVMESALGSVMSFLESLILVRGW